jgi:phosphoribosylanthranilate isomerase
MVRIKVCGITREADLDVALSLGVEMVGFNFVPASPRRITPARAAELARHVNGRCETVAVVADLSLPELNDLRKRSGVESLQLHGAEPPELLQQLAAGDYKALRVATASDVARAREYPGSRILVDAKVEGVLGGTGHVFDWSLVLQLARERSLLLAGGLGPSNVRRAVDSVAPWAVDSASGVETSPGIKDPEKMANFVAEARANGKLVVP